MENAARTQDNRVQRCIKQAKLPLTKSIDEFGADILFQVISQRYEQGSIMLTTNNPFKNGLSFLATTARWHPQYLIGCLHHARPILIEEGIATG